MDDEDSTGKCRYCEYEFKDESDKLKHNTGIDAGCCGRCRDKPSCYFCAGMFCYCSSH